MSTTTYQSIESKLLHLHSELEDSSITHLLGRRQQPSQNLEPSKRFKPNLDSSRIRSSLNTSKGSSSEEFSQTTSETESSGQKFPHFNEDLVSEKSKRMGYETTKIKPLRGAKDLHIYNEMETVSSTTSPSMISVTSSDMVAELNLDPSDNCSNNESLSGTSLEDFIDMLKQKKGLICLSKGLFLTLKCVRGHVFTAERTEKIQCPKCVEIIEKCSEYAEFNKGNIINKYIGKLIINDCDEYLNFECKNHHIWKIKYSK